MATRSRWGDQLLGDAKDVDSDSRKPVEGVNLLLLLLAVIIELGGIG